MGEQIQITAGDGFTFGAYQAAPAGRPRGGLVVIQEIFGVNPHIRSVVDRYAAEGFVTIAPAIYDRAERDYEAVPGKETAMRGRELRAEVGETAMLTDIDATCRELQSAGKVAIVGYCLGGSLAWAAACNIDGFSAAIGYYGGSIAASATVDPKCPVMLHFGELDQGIPMTDVAKIRAATEAKDVQVFTYPDAPHGFNRDGSPAYHEASAKLALGRTMEHLAGHVG